MKAFDTYGSRCNGCGNYAEWCHCKIDSKGNLVEARDGCNRQRDPVYKYPDSNGR